MPGVLWCDFDQRMEAGLAGEDVRRTMGLLSPAQKVLMGPASRLPSPPWPPPPDREQHLAHLHSGPQDTHVRTLRSALRGDLGSGPIPGRGHLSPLSLRLWGPLLPAFLPRSFSLLVLPQDSSPTGRPLLLCRAPLGPLAPLASSG